MDKLFFPPCTINLILSMKHILQKSEIRRPSFNFYIEILYRKICDRYLDTNECNRKLGAQNRRFLALGIFETKILARVTQRKSRWNWEKTISCALSHSAVLSASWLIIFRLSSPIIVASPPLENRTNSFLKIRCLLIFRGRSTITTTTSERDRSIGDRVDYRFLSIAGWLPLSFILFDRRLDFRLLGVSRLQRCIQLDYAPLSIMRNNWRDLNVYTSTYAIFVIVIVGR